MNEYIFNEIDQVANIDLGGRKSRHLHHAARGPRPLCLEAAETLEKSAEEGGNILITSGFPIIPDEKPETDGPPGAILLSKAVKNLGAAPVLLVDELSSGVHRKLAEALDMEEIDMIEVPTDPAEAEEACSSILEEYEPQLLVSIEKPGVNEDGTYRNMSGEDVSELVGKVDPLFEEALEKDIPTIGVGDGGNEIGMGNIEETVKEKIPHGESIASETEVQSLVVSAVSNWGAYGILGALSALTGEMMVHDRNLERKLIETCVEAGAVDGVSKKRELSVDGIPCRFHENILETIRYLSSEALKKYHDGSNR